MEKYIKSESLRSVLYFLLMMGAIFGVQYINELFLPWSMLGIFIFIFFVLFKIIGAGRNVLLPTIVITSIIFFFVVFVTLPRSERGVESYIEHKYSLKQYKVIKCDYFGVKSVMPLRCVVPGYPEAEKEANLIINFLNLLTFSPISIAVVVMAVRFSRYFKK